MPANFKQKDIETLTEIIERDYGVALNDEEAGQLGFSLLKITRLTMGAFNRVEEQRSVAIMS